MERIVPFPLYHGSSTHYLHAFQPGGRLARWPLKEDAIDLLREVWTRLTAYGVEPEFWIRNMLEQKTGPANWRHGVLHVTPSQRTAVNYAGGYAGHGGELMTHCREGLDRLAEVDESAERNLQEQAAPAIRELLAGGGEPILVEFFDVSVCSLEPETGRDRDQEIERLLGLTTQERELIGQQTNFQLSPGNGTVKAVRLLDIATPGHPISAFSKAPVPD